MEGLDNYKTGRKNNWRRTCWNEIARRIPDRKNAKVLYLAGEQDLDRAVAISKGFNANNMVAVDARKKVVEKLRGEGKLAIHGMIDTVAMGMEFDVLLADMVCGIRESAINLMLGTLFHGRQKESAVLLYNFLRGREIGISREFLRVAQERIQSLPHERSAVVSKHRGYIFLYLILVLHELDWIKQGVDLVTRHDNIAYCRERMEPFFLSYRSASGQIFDTLIINNPFPKKYKKFTEWLSDNPCSEIFLGPKSDKIQSVLPQISAIKAVQTMRKNGTLNPCRNY